MNKSSETTNCVLLVEDDDAVRRGIQLLLRSHRYEVRAYPSAVGLAKDPEALRCGCMIADLLMPHTGAIELLRELKAAGWAGKAILISGHLDDAWEAQACAAGYDRVLPKPLSDSVLMRTLGEVTAIPTTD